MKKLLTFIWAAALTLTSCGGSSDTDTPTPVTPEPEEPQKETILEPEKNTLEFECTGGTQTLMIKASEQPTVATYTSTWCTSSIKASSIEDQYEMTVISAVNPNDARKLSLSLRAGTKSSTITINQKEFSVETATTAAVTPQERCKALGMGWNLGNQMDAHNNGVASETCWGNKKCTQQTFNNIKAAGISTVRIPVTWMGQFGEGPEYTIKDTWMNRVYEIVGYAEKAGVNVIVNMHHDGADSQYWLSIKDAASGKQSAIKQEFATLWYQIALKFKDKGDFLMFEPFNEIQDGGWGWGGNLTDGGKQYRYLNEWLQTFVKVVRLAGGENSTRWLGCPGYSANPDLTMANMTFPEDYVTSNRLMAAVHDYDPYEYSLNCTYNEWGHTGTPSDKASGKDGNEEEETITSTFKKLNEKYVAAGYPTYVGEMGATFRAKARHVQFQKYYLEYVTKAAHSYCLSPIVWDNGTDGTGTECSGYFNHADGRFISYKGTDIEYTSEEMVRAMVKGATDESPEYTLEWVFNNSAPAKEE